MDCFASDDAGTKVFGCHGRAWPAIHDIQAAASLCFDARAQARRDVEGSAIRFDGALPILVPSGSPPLGLLPREGAATFARVTSPAQPSFRGEGEADQASCTQARRAGPGPLISPRETINRPLTKAGDTLRWYSAPKNVANNAVRQADQFRRTAATL